MSSQGSFQVVDQIDEASAKSEASQSQDETEVKPADLNCESILYFS